MPRACLISTKQFTSAQQVQRFLDVVPPYRGDQSMVGYLMATLFYQPSTRTRMSFESAMIREGGHVISSENAAEFSSAIKGETLEDTIRVVSEYADVIVLRHPEVGAAERAMRHCTVNLVNAGDGTGEHPSQALLDLYTVYKECGRIGDLRFALVGDLKGGRTIHSLLYLLSLFEGVSIATVCPEGLELPHEQCCWMEDQKWQQWKHMRSINEMLDWSPDVVYMTRAQEGSYKYSEDFLLSTRHMERLHKSCRILHPLPRQQELDVALDKDSRSCWFKQVRYGVQVRKTILHQLFTGPLWDKYDE